MPEISVIVPAYNSAPYLDQCVQSILDQDYKDFELILVDDGSTDDTLIKCKQWSETDRRIIVLHKENGGLSDARNYGIDHANGEYLTFIDSDDYVSKDYLSYLLQLFSLSNRCMITTCNRQIIKYNGNPGHKFDYQDDTGVIVDKKEGYKKALFSEVSHGAWARLFKRSVFLTLRFPVGVKHEDTYILGDFIEAGDEMVFGNKVGYFYISHEGSIVHTPDAKRLNDLIESTQRLARMAVACDPSLTNAGICKVGHATFSALSVIDLGTAENRIKANQWKKELIKNRKVILKEKRNLKRDKIGMIMLLIGGIPLYKTVYKIYDRLMKETG